MARKRYKNVSDTLQVVYDETGQKREVIPRGTVVLDERIGQKFTRVLAEVPKTRRSSANAPEDSAQGS